MTLSQITKWIWNDNNLDIAAITIDNIQNRLKSVSLTILESIRKKTYVKVGAPIRRINGKMHMHFKRDFRPLDFINATLLTFNVI